MSTVLRRVEVNAQGYHEVSLEHRVARARALEEAQVHLRAGRIHCPMLDACRTDVVYGAKALPRTDKEGMTQWSEALDLALNKALALSYISGPLHNAPHNAIHKEFDENEVNTGFLKSLKRGVHTGIIGTGTFEQNQLNRLVWAVHPKLNGTAIEHSFVYSSATEAIYLDEGHLDTIIDHNVSVSAFGWKGVGPRVSRVEIGTLLFRVLGQRIVTDPQQPDRTMLAVSVRDLHDFYKYVVFPAPVEAHLEAASLIRVPASFPAA